ncbi:hypothetical protein BURK1_02467 [Burkholderiales bacterium]|nr:hypothetical protein BURK1_02467 [Burkholderiales bacterium]
MNSLATLRALAAGRDPETLVGPLFHLFTRLAAAADTRARGALADHLTVLAAHPGVDPQLRLAAGALALEHRGSGW